MLAREKFCREKAGEVASRKADGTPIYGVPIRQMRAATWVAWCLWSRYRLASIARRAYNNPLKVWHEAQMGNQSAQWSKSSDVIPMFPTLVWKIELEAQLREVIGSRVLAALTHLRRDLPLAPGLGWQSVQSLHELDDFRDLVSCVHRIVPGILRFLRIGYDAYEVTACWATVLARGAAHKMHQPPNNFLSGVYLQHHVFFVHGESEQAAMVSGGCADTRVRDGNDRTHWPGSIFAAIALAVRP
jgi:hypothetical protein